jgi:hypothetical protein
MPHYACLACRTRLYNAGSPADHVGDLCPDCGTLLEPVGDVAEVIGFRSIKPRDNNNRGRKPRASHERNAGRIGDFLTRRQAIIAQARLDAEQWLDDSDSFSPDAVALAQPDPSS